MAGCLECTGMYDGMNSMMAVMAGMEKAACKGLFRWPAFSRRKKAAVAYDVPRPGRLRPCSDLGMKVSWSSCRVRW